MKKSLLLPALFAIFSFASCTKEQIDPIGAQDTPEKAEARLAINTVSNSFLTGNWSIASCISSVSDETSRYKGYSFRFATNNAIVVKEGINAGTVGKWSVSYIDGKTRVSFTFTPGSDFAALNGDWTMLDGSDAKKILMQNVVEQKCYLTLEKL